LIFAENYWTLIFRHTSTSSVAELNTSNPDLADPFLFNINPCLAGQARKFLSAEAGNQDNPPPIEK